MALDDKLVGEDIHPCELCKLPTCTENRVDVTFPGGEKLYYCLLCYFKYEYPEELEKQRWRKKKGLPNIYDEGR